MDCLGLVGGTIMIMYTLMFFKRMYSRKKSKELLIFSRYPAPGTTKTRLIPELGEEGAAYAQLLMTDHLLDNVEEYCSQDKDLATKVYYNGGTDKQMKYWLGKRKYDLSWQQQTSGGLGVKIAEALKDSFNRGSSYTIIIGSDIPGISPDIITQAYKALQSGSDMVLGPAADGGYYLVGVSNSVIPKLDDLFSGINWGTETVFKEQSEKAKTLRVSLNVLSTVLNDVDLPEDLQFMEKELNVSRSQIMNPQISIVIPVYNEASTILSTLQTILKNCLNLQVLKEIIISDGGSTDDTVSIVKKFSSTTKTSIRVVSSPPGRGFQLKHGTQQATGDFLMFIHADTGIPEHFDKAAINCLRKPGNVAGTFYFSLDCLEIPEKTKECSHWFLMKMKFLRYTVLWRTKYGEFPYGDQILCTTRKNYDKVGGFRELYLMEDFILVEELRKLGHIGIGDTGPAVTSYRRWKKWGLIKVTGHNWLTVFAYKLGVSPDTLAMWYYGDKLKKIKRKQS